MGNWLHNLDEPVNEIRIPSPIMNIDEINNKDWDLFFAGNCFWISLTNFLCTNHVIKTIVKMREKNVGMNGWEGLMNKE